MFLIEQEYMNNKLGTVYWITTSNILQVLCSVTFFFWGESNVCHFFQHSSKIIKLVKLQKLLRGLC